jgi:2-amino-4-hydroxy-6-hydroxymethyldihydropteridine diphosphokinase
MMKGVFLLLGSNLGDRMEMLNNAGKLIESSIGKILRFSSVYMTKAWGVEDQPDFLNQVFEVETSHSPEKLLGLINEIENQLGRVRDEKWHSRSIDIDILYYGDQIVEKEKLVIPHKENENRKFVLIPMVEIAPQFIHPKYGLTQHDLLRKCKDRLEVQKI